MLSGVLWVLGVGGFIAFLVFVCVMVLRDSIPAWRAHGFWYDMPGDGRRGPRTAGSQTLYLLGVLAAVAAAVVVALRQMFVKRFGSRPTVRAPRGPSWIERHSKALGRLGVAFLVLMGLGLAYIVISWAVGSVVLLWTGMVDWIAQGGSGSDDARDSPAVLRVILGLIGTVLFGGVVLLYVRLAFTLAGERLARRRREKAKSRAS
ncbi:hypothetical protein CLV28_2987 [Sediminihabitans luteus]|uniref:Uncharacterized protein n=1 Tax=Sediminihabitans luteus TaxID=1138585 RepID=A0A2M9CBZ0_9CELL|nr:hypothetical protein CLV28_2987 [Sediminihabitans luteus]GII99907.1 hypothetical protein Slu03_22850 [Sediminihabitans luteus]